MGVSLRLQRRLPGNVTPMESVMNLSTLRIVLHAVAAFGCGVLSYGAAHAQDAASPRAGGCRSRQRQRGGASSRDPLVCALRHRCRRGSAARSAGRRRQQLRADAEGAVWTLWSRSGDAEVDKLLQGGIRDMNQGRMAQAVETFTRVIERKPDFVEGWNKRATAYYLMEDLEQSLKDCDEVIKRNPRHFGALSGYGLIYIKRASSSTRWNTSSARSPSIRICRESKRASS
jgi:tetratricopeptide (TPR) repeat protein